MSPELSVFINEQKAKIISSNHKTITIEDIVKHHNHELWRVCLQCAHSFDAKKELYWDRCPKCNSKNIK